MESTSPVEADWDLLEGTWEVVFTTASDVVPIVGTGVPGVPLRVGQVSQRFSSPAEGRVQNIIEVEATDLLFGGSKATLVVDAAYSVRTARSIALEFQSAGVEKVEIGGLLQTLAAPALLPRGWWNMQLLQAAEQLAFSVPLSTRPPGVSSSSRQPVGINYNITYLDADMLIGRAQGSGGTFIFRKAKDSSSGGGGDAGGDGATW